jgi:hypothetical protein
MITRKFKYDLLEMICTADTRSLMPKNIKIIREDHEHTGVWTYSDIIFELVDEWKFYKICAQHNARRDSLMFATHVLDDWVDDDVIECAEVVPHMKQIVVYEEIES